MLSLHGLVWLLVEAFLTELCVHLFHELLGIRLFSLPQYYLDHTLLLLSLKSREIVCPHLFRCQSMWVPYVYFQDVVTPAWNSPFYGHPIDLVMGKLTKTGQIQSWDFNVW